MKFCFRAFSTSAVLFLTQFISYAQALPPSILYTSVIAKSRGGAFVSLTEDSESLFLNPAGLAAHSGFSFDIFQGSVGSSGETVAIYRRGTSSPTSLGVKTLDLLMGENIYVKGQGVSKVAFENFAIGFLADVEGYMGMENKVFPLFDTGYVRTQAVQAAYGFTVFGSPTSKKKRKRRRERVRQTQWYGDLRVGIAAKMVMRSGYYKRMPVSELMAFEASTLTDRANGAMSTGYSGDIGIQYVKSLNRNTVFSLGATYTDIGSIGFANGATPVPQDFRVGGGLKFDVNFVDLKVAYDQSNVFDSIDWRKKSHLGVEVGFPLVRFYGGLNQTYLTYGASVDLWLFRIAMGSWQEDTTNQPGVNPTRRFLIQTDFKISF